MGLIDFAIPTEKVTLPDGKTTFDVRGISLEDIVVLVRNHRGAMAAFYDRMMVGRDDADFDVTETVLEDLLTEAPLLGADIIALAADSLEQAPLVRKLPFPVQIDALDKIAKLTFDAEGGPKKVIETVVRVMQGMNSLQADKGSTSG